MKILLQMAEKLCQQDQELQVLQWKVPMGWPLMMPPPVVTTEGNQWSQSVGVNEGPVIHLILMFSVANPPNDEVHQLLQVALTTCGLPDVQGLSALHYSGGNNTHNSCLPSAGLWWDHFTAEGWSRPMPASPSVVEQILEGHGQGGAISTPSWTFLWMGECHPPITMFLWQIVIFAGQLHTFVVTGCMDVPLLEVIITMAIYHLFFLFLLVMLNGYCP